MPWNWLWLKWDDGCVWIVWKFDAHGVGCMPILWLAKRHVDEFKSKSRRTCTDEFWPWIGWWMFWVVFRKEEKEDEIKVLQQTQEKEQKTLQALPWKKSKWIVSKRFIESRILARGRSSRIWAASTWIRRGCAFWSLSFSSIIWIFGAFTILTFLLVF